MRKHPNISALIGVAIFLCVSLPEWFGSVWPLFTSKTLPEWIAERRWTPMSTSATSWLMMVFAVAVTGLMLVIVYQTRQQARTAEFYEDRSALRVDRHSIQEELERLGDSFWVMWQVGHQMTQIAPEARKKISKMILGNPNDTPERLDQ